MNTTHEFAIKTALQDPGYRMKSGNNCIEDEVLIYSHTCI